MKRVAMALLVGVCMLAPAVARADDGGWLEFLFRLDPKLVGFGTDVHLLCFNKSNELMKWKNCEELFGIPRLVGRGPVNPDDMVKYNDIRHEVDFRVGFYWKYGQRFVDVDDERSIKAFKLMLMYRYHADDHIVVGAGFGFMPFFGDFGPGAGAFSRGILTPLSVSYFPWRSGGGALSTLFLRGESTYITQGFSGADFGNAQTTYATDGGYWNTALAIGFDLRRKARP